MHLTTFNFACLFIFFRNARQQMTQNEWHFSCQCPRCRDPTEMGTMMTAVRCEKCKSNGFLLPTRPTELKSDWKCSQCEETKSAGNMMELCLKIEAQVEKAKVKHLGFLPQYFSPFLQAQNIQGNAALTNVLLHRYSRLKVLIYFLSLFLIFYFSGRRQSVQYNF